jgi:hypothetical protein
LLNEARTFDEPRQLRLKVFNLLPKTGSLLIFKENTLDGTLAYRIAFVEDKFCRRNKRRENKF